MRSHDDPSRATIAGRRAMFLTSALAALSGCNSTAPEKPTQPVVELPTGNSRPVLTAKPVGTSEPIPKPIDKMPPLDVPSNVSDEAKSRFERLASAVPRMHKELAELEKLYPENCPLQQARCDEQWKNFAIGLLEFDWAVSKLGGRCAGSSDDAKLFAKRLHAHRQLLRKKRGRLLKRVEAAKKAAGSDGQRQWTEHQDAARKARPRPCLKYHCPEW